MCLIKQTKRTLPPLINPSKMINECNNNNKTDFSWGLVLDKENLCDILHKKKKKNKQEKSTDIARPSMKLLHVRTLQCQCWEVILCSLGLNNPTLTQIFLTTLKREKSACTFPPTPNIATSLGRCWMGVIKIIICGDKAVNYTVQRIHARTQSSQWTRF